MITLHIELYQHLYAAVHNFLGPPIMKWIFG